jgi:hypothetical protein
MLMAQTKVTWTEACCRSRSLWKLEINSDKSGTTWNSDFLQAILLLDTWQALGAATSMLLRHICVDWATVSLTCFCCLSVFIFGMNSFSFPFCLKHMKINSLQREPDRARPKAELRSPSPGTDSLVWIHNTTIWCRTTYVRGKAETSNWLSTCVPVICRQGCCLLLKADDP